jgi:hypothetical protein
VTLSANVAEGGSRVRGRRVGNMAVEATVESTDLPATAPPRKWIEERDREQLRLFDDRVPRVTGTTVRRRR